MTHSPPDIFNLSEHLVGQRLAEGLETRRAILTDQGTLTFGDVLRRTNRYGNLLCDADVRPEERVIVALPDGPDFVGALFGILRIGSVVVMVNPDLGAEQLRYFFEYTRARAAIVHAGVADTFAEAAEGARHAPRRFVVGDPETDRALEAASSELDPFPTHRDDAAIWLFSGGTTGKPKAVVQSHRSFANTTELYGRGVLDIKPDDITMSVPKLFFGYATGSNLFFPFASGGACALFPERCTPETIFEKIARFRPTVLVNVPTMIQKMLEHPGASTRDLSSIRLATSAGEPLPVDLHRRWDETFGIPLLDGLGTAEMWHIFISNQPDDIRPGTLGKPVPGFDVRVCDEDGRPLGTDEVGYLWVRGDSRAQGYWQQMDKTRTAFRGEWYVSGDMISIDAEGYVTYRGRADDMLKVSGKWLSPRELEDCLLRHPAVAEVAVIGVTGDDGLVKPHAFVRTQDPADAEEELAAALKIWAREHLEAYKYPRRVVFVDDFPRTHLGKIDRGRLARTQPQPTPSS